MECMNQTLTREPRTRNANHCTTHDDQTFDLSTGHAPSRGETSSCQTQRPLTKKWKLNTDFFFERNQNGSTHQEGETGILPQKTGPPCQTAPHPCPPWVRQENTASGVRKTDMPVPHRWLVGRKETLILLQIRRAARPRSNHLHGELHPMPSRPRILAKMCKI